MKNISLFRLIFTTFLMISTVSVITMFLILNGRFTQQRDLLLTKISKEMNQTIIEKTTHYLLPAILVAETSSKLSKNNVIDISNISQMEQYFITQINAYPQLSKIYLGKENGDFIMVYKDNNNHVFSKLIYNDSKQEIIKHYQRDGHISHIEKNETTFDPRTRNWYDKANMKGKRVWTDLYMFFTGKRPGVTASYPLYDSESTLKGVFGVDLELSKITEFLSFQNKYFQSKIIILNYKNQIVSQTGNIIFKTLKDGQVVPLHINEHQNLLVKKAYTHLEKYLVETIKDNKEISIQYNNEGFLISLVNFPDYFGKNWKVMTILPKKHVLNDVIPTQWIMYVILILTVLMVLIVSIIIARTIEKPLKQLTFDLQRLRYKNIDGKTIASSLVEISELINIYTIIKKLYSDTFKKKIN